MADAGLRQHRLATLLGKVPTRRLLRPGLLVRPRPGANGCAGEFGVEPSPVVLGASVPGCLSLIRRSDNMNYPEHGVRVGACPYGRGVFALREFAPRELLGPIEGPIMDDLQYESDYCMELGENGCIEPDAPFRFLNHSCQPNCRLTEYDVRHEDGTRCAELWLTVETAVAPGEQMTIDYGWPAEHAIPCRCGSPLCRHWIVAADELENLRKERDP